MNHKQRYVAIGAVVAVVLTMLFPPFHFRLPNGVVVNLGYGFLFDPPQRSAGYVGSVTVELLLLEWVAILIVAGALYWIVRHPASNALDPKQTVAENSKKPSLRGRVVRALIYAVGLLVIALILAFAKGVGKGLSHYGSKAPNAPATSNYFDRFDAPQKLAPTSLDEIIEEAKVEAAHPGWERLINTPEFKAWLQAQNEEVKKLEESPRAADAIKLLDLYKAGHSPATRGLFEIEELLYKAPSWDGFLQSARKAGYSDTEIANHLSGVVSFDADGARRAGYSDAEILNHLSGQFSFDSTRAQAKIKM